jgi:hypothetical protein
VEEVPQCRGRAQTLAESLKSYDFPSRFLAPVDVVVSQTLCLHTVMCGTGLPPPIPLQMSPAAFEGWGNSGKSLCACKIDTWTKAGQPNNHRLMDVSLRQV